MKLGCLCETIFSGGTPNTSNADYWNGEFHWLSSGETRNTYIFNTEKTITQKGINNSSTRLAKKNDILIASAGQGKTRGQVSYCMIDTYINQSLISMRADPKLLDPKFLFYNLTSRYNELRTLSDSSSSRGSLTIPILENIDILLPPLKQQKTIATILSNYDDLVENNSKRIKILEDTAQKIYKEWFVDFKYPGHETATFKDTELGKIPSDWKITQIKSEFKTVLGGTPSRNNSEYWGGEIPWLSSGKTNELRIITESEFITELGLKKSSTKLMPKYTTLLAITGATLGQVSMIGAAMCANQSVVGIINDKYQEYIFYMIKNNISDLILKASGGAQQHINKDIVNDMSFIMPKSNILENFEKIVKPINDNIFILLYKNKKLQQVRDLLLPSLIRGEIDVDGLEIV